jgi:uncharacterized protein YodC (DUF2158 family)
VEFALGDVVHLKSGGPSMTVERFGKDQKTQEDVIFCTWFETVGKRQELSRGSFPPIVLEKYEPSFGIATTRV